MIGFSLRYRRTIVAAWAALLVASIAVLGVRVLSKAPLVDNSVGIWFMKDDPELGVYEDFNQQFGQKEWSLVLLQADSIFDPLFLRDLAQISARIAQVEHITKVLSLTNVKDSAPSGDGALTYQQLYPIDAADGLLTAAQVDEFRARLYENPIFEHSILKRGDPHTTVLLFQNDNFIHSPEPYRIVMVDAVKSVLDDYPRLRGYSLAGTSIVNAELNRASQRDGIRFYLLVTFFIIVAAYASLRNWRDLVVVLANVTASALPPMALLAAFSIPYNMVTVMLPPILITLSVCDVVHLINGFHEERRRLGPAPAIVRAVESMRTPCTWTTVVAVVSFLSLAASTVLPIWQLGVFAAIGIGLAWLMTMTCVPILLLALWPRGRTGHAEGADGAKPVGLYSARLLRLQLGNWRWVWLSAGGVMMLATYGIGQLQVDTDYTKFFGKDMYITRSYTQLAKAGYGQSPVSLMLRFPDGTNYASGDTFARILRFQERIRKDPAVIKLLSVTDLLDRADRAFSGPDAAEGRLRSYNADQIGQLQLMAELGGNDDLRDFVTDDKRTLQAIAMTSYMSSKELASLKERVYAAGRATLPADVTLKVTGTTVQWANMDREVSHTQMSSMYIISYGLPRPPADHLQVLDPRRDRCVHQFGAHVDHLRPDGPAEHQDQHRDGTRRRSGGRIDHGQHHLLHQPGAAGARRRDDRRGGGRSRAADDRRRHHHDVGDPGRRVRLSRDIELPADVELRRPRDLVHSGGAVHGHPRESNSLEAGGQRGGLCSRPPARFQRASKGGTVTLLAMTSITALVIGQVLTPGAGSGPAAGGTDQGRQIFAEVSRRNAGYGDQRAGVSMQLKRKSGAATTRTMDIATLEVANDGTRSIVLFDSPLDVKGTKVLTYSHGRAGRRAVDLPAGFQAGEADRGRQQDDVVHGE